MKCNGCGGRFGHGEYCEKTNLCWCCAVHADSVAAPVVAVKPVPAKPAAKQTPENVCRVRAMRAFWQTAKAAGLDTDNAEGMRAALAEYFGCIVWSRRNLSSGQWLEAVAGLECNLIAW